MSKRHNGSQKGSRKRREGYLQVRVDEAEKKAFEAAASLCGLGVSGWVRERLRQAAVRELLESGQPNPFV